MKRVGRRDIFFFWMALSKIKKTDTGQDSLPFGLEGKHSRTNSSNENNYLLRRGLMRRRKLSCFRSLKLIHRCKLKSSEGLALHLGFIGILNEQYITYFVNKIMNNILELTTLHSGLACCSPCCGLSIAVYHG